MAPDDTRSADDALPLRPRRLRFAPEDDADMAPGDDAPLSATSGLPLGRDAGVPPDRSTAIATHPAFPGFVAAWFAALFGIGAAILPIAVLESLAWRTHIYAVFGPATPPLGTTARILFALACAVPGALLGLFLASRVIASVDRPVAARAPAPRRRKTADRHRDAPAKRPISAIEELGAEGLGPVRGVGDGGAQPLPARATTATTNAPPDDERPAISPPAPQTGSATPTVEMAPADLSRDPVDAVAPVVVHAAPAAPAPATPPPQPASKAATAPRTVAGETPLEALGWPAMVERFAAALTATAEPSPTPGDHRVATAPPPRAAPDPLRGDPLREDPVRTERALREALDRLGRLSGAA